MRRRIFPIVFFRLQSPLKREEYCAEISLANHITVGHLFKSSREKKLTAYAIHKKEDVIRWTLKALCENPKLFYNRKQSYLGKDSQLSYHWILSRWQTYYLVRLSEIALRSGSSVLWAPLFLPYLGHSGQGANRKLDLGNVYCFFGRGIVPSALKEAMICILLNEWFFDPAVLEK